MCSASSAKRTCSAPRSASENTAILRMFMSRSARMMRTAISPRFATKTLLNMHGDFNKRVGPKSALHQAARCFHANLDPVDNEEFRRYGHQVVDWIAGYLEDIRQYPVLPDMQPGDLVDRLP